jgi:hypothetical protein
MFFTTPQVPSNRWPLLQHAFWRHANPTQVYQLWQLGDGGVLRNTNFFYSMFAPVASLDQTNKQGKISEAIGDKAQILLELFHLSLPTVVSCNHSKSGSTGNTAVSKN